MIFLQSSAYFSPSSLRLASSLCQQVYLPMASRLNLRLIEKSSATKRRQQEVRLRNLSRGGSSVEDFARSYLLLKRKQRDKKPPREKLKKRIARSGRCIFSWMGLLQQEGL